MKETQMDFDVWSRTHEDQVTDSWRQRESESEFVLMLNFSCQLVFTYIIAFSFTFYCINANSSTASPGESHLDKVSSKIFNTISAKEANNLIPKMLWPFSHNLRKAEKRKFSYKPSRLQEQNANKKSFVEEGEHIFTKNPAYQLAFSEPSVYLRNENIFIEKLEPHDYTSVKRFAIPRSSNTKLSSRIPVSIPAFSKNLESRSQVHAEKKEQFSKADSVTPGRSQELDVGVPTSSENRLKRQLEDESMEQDDDPVDSVPQYTLAMPTNDLAGQVRSEVNGISGGNVMTVVPMKVERPVVMAAVPSVALTTTGTERSTMPISSIIQPVQSNQLVESRQLAPLVDPQSSNPAQEAISFIAQPERQSPVIKLANAPTQEQNPVFNLPRVSPRKKNPTIKFANVPVEILDSVDDPKNKQKKTSSENENEDVNKINENVLESLQLKLTDIISRLEEKVNKKEGRRKGKSKQVNSKVNEKSLKFLKGKLSQVLAKFKSKPGTRQPFTVGKEWAHLLSGGKSSKKVGLLKNKKTSSISITGSQEEGHWPAIASQLLGRLNKALAKLQERKVAKSLEKNAVMYFNFDDAEPSTNEQDVIKDKSGHFNEATLSNKAHVSSRRYGSCGKALILNSGNLHYVENFFKNKPTKAITLAMWVRTNATGFVRWFAQDSEMSHDFSTTTQYPLVHKNVWTHLCGTFNSATGITRIYVNGELKVEKVNVKRDNTIPADFTPAGIGSDFGDNNLIAVDEVYLFSRALSEKEVQAVYDNCDFNRMVLHYGFQKINRTAGVVFDQSGLNNNALLKGEANILDGGCDKCGSCLDLNVQGDPRLTIQGNKFEHRPTKAISLAAWVNLNSTTGTHPLVDVSDAFAKTTLLNLRVTDGKLRWTGRNKNRNEIFDMNTDQSVIPEGVWVHVLVMFNSFSGSAKIFVDGHEKAFAKTAKKDPIGEDWGEIKVGGRVYDSSDPGGFIDELVMYNWELELPEISYIMKYCPDHPKLVSFTVHVPLE